MLVEVMGAFGVREALQKHVKVFARGREHDEEHIIMALVLLLASGGEYFDDLRPLKNDVALAQLLGFRFPSPETARQFLYEFHEDRLIDEEVAKLGPEKRSYVPKESKGLSGLGRVVQALTGEVQRRWPAATATLDFDATFQASQKREAKMSYGGPGYQPMLATWVEQGLVVFDEFRDGNVAPAYESLSVVQRGFGALPEGIKQRLMRADSASYSVPLLRWMCAENIEFAIGAQMRKGLKDICNALPPERWKHMETRRNSVLHVAEVDFSPKGWLPSDPQLRYIAVRITPTQSDLFPVDEDAAEEEGDENEADQGCNGKVRLLGVVTNRKLGPAELLRWYWEKGGTVEHVHDVLKNDLGAGVFPCGRFGANAAWLRIAVLTHNLLCVVKRIAPAELRDARPKRLRLHLFAIPALLKRHARSVIATVSRLASRLIETRNALWAPYAAPAG